jgi:flotillin
LAEIAGAGQAIKIKQITVLPSGGDAGAPLARKAIATAEQIRAATGVDVAELLRRLGGTPAAPALPSDAAVPPKTRS